MSEFEDKFWTVLINITLGAVMFLGFLWLPAKLIQSGIIQQKVATIVNYFRG